MTTITSTKADAKSRVPVLYIIHAAISLFFMFGFRFLPPLFDLDQLGMSVVGIFVGMLYAWIALGTYVWPCLAGLISLEACGFDTMNNILATGFGNNLIPFLIMIFVYVIFLEKAGVCARISNWFLGRKIVVGHPWILITFICLSAYVMAICTYCYPAVLIPWAIAYSICEEAGYKKGDRFPALLVLAISVSAFCGYTALPIKAVAALSLGLTSTSTNGEYTVSFAEYSTFMVPMTLLSMFVFLALMRFVFKADVSKLANIDNKRFAEASKAPMSRTEKAAFISMVAFIVMMCLPTILPESWAITQLFSGWGMNGPIFIVLIFLALFMIDGKSILDFPSVANSGHVDWNVIIMTASCFSVAAAIESEEVGIMDNVFAAVMPILEYLSPALFIIIAFVLMSILTQFLHNLVLASVMTPVLVRFALIVGVNPGILAIIMTYAFSIALVTPAASAMAAMTHSNDWVSSSLCYKALGAHFVIAMVLVLVIFGPIAIFLN